MSKAVAVLAMCLAAQAGFTQDRATSDEPLAADQPSEKVATPVTAESAEGDGEVFKPPRGFQTRKRRDLVLYCKREATIGTRFKTEKCYDEKQMREYMLALEMQKNDVDRIRATCGGGILCNPPDPTPR